MSFTYAEKKRTQGQMPGTAPQPTMDELRAGTAAPSAEQMGHRVDLPDAMREKMENAFGADLSAVRLYESEAVRDAGAEAVTQGSSIAFAPGMLDFSSYGGQVRLGHEISHVVSQARGEVTGSGLLNDHALEARAEREGAMAASGQQISAPAEAMSPVSVASATGPMQCRNKRQSNKMLDELHRIGHGKLSNQRITSEDEAYYNQNIGTLSPREMKMMQKRMRKSMRDKYDLYQEMSKNADPNAGDSRAFDTELFYSDPNTSMRAYELMTSDFMTANNYSSSQSEELGRSFRGVLTRSDRKKVDEMDDHELYEEPTFKRPSQYFAPNWREYRARAQRRMRGVYDNRGGK